MRELAEVFTHQREVDAMLNQIPDAFTELDIRFLEPACGSGNFLVEILRRKVALPMHPGDDLVETTAFNAKDLREILQATSGDLVKMESRAALKPAAFIGDVPDRLIVLQPVRLAG